MRDFTFNGSSIGFTDADFGQWAFSDLLSNVTRGVLAEFLVANALGIKDDNRISWNAYDLKYGTKTIEVKSSAYIQSWNGDQHSKINFSIGQKLGWYADSNKVGELKRHADIYVFCVLTCRERQIVEPRNLDQWEFYVVSTNDMNEKIPNQKTIGLNSLVNIFDLKPLNFKELKRAVDEVVAWL